MKTPAKTPAGSPGFYSDRVAVLMYHAFDTPATSSIMVTGAQFADHLRALKAAGFRFIGPDQFRAWKSGQGTVPPNAVLITIDDGYKEVLTVALPLMQQYGAPGIAFVPFARVGRSPAVLTRDDLMALEAGGIEVQSHTWDLHYRVTRDDGTTVAVARTLTEEALRADAAKAREVYGGWFGRAPEMLAYPFGAYTPEFIRAAQAEGIVFGFTVEPGLVARNTNNMTLPRINAGVRGLTGAQLVEKIRRYAR